MPGVLRWGWLGVVGMVWSALGCGGSGSSNYYPPDASDEAVCTPGDTRTCVGPGACDGGQTCNENGAWEECDCGLGTGGAGDGGAGPEGAGGTGASGGSTAGGGDGGRAAFGGDGSGGRSATGGSAGQGAGVAGGGGLGGGSAGSPAGVGGSAGAAGAGIGSGGTAGVGTGASSGAPTGGEAGAPPVAVCGDGALTAPTEDCDDGNTEGGDGCTSTCVTEAGYSCPTPGQACVPVEDCGDGELQWPELCDDGDAVPGDGCNADCALEAGWICPTPNADCRPECGDGLMVGSETCDDGNVVSDDGCSAICRSEPMAVCSGQPSTCTLAECGDGIVELGELCDLGTNNGLSYGDGLGCSLSCTPEPLCRPVGGGATGACTSICGDGMLAGSEECDDGNTFNGDGCSSTCIVDAGFTCSTSVDAGATSCLGGTGECLRLGMVLRDFLGAHESGGHPDFFYLGANGVFCVPDASGTGTGDSTPRCMGLVQSTLSNSGKPAFAGSGASACECQFTDRDGTGILSGVPGVVYDMDAHPVLITTVNVIESAASFAQWYDDVAGINTTVRDELELQQVTPGQFQFSSTNGQTIADDIAAGRTLSSGFFPLESQSETKICNLWPYWDVPSWAWASSADWMDCLGDQWDPIAEQFVTSAGVPRNYYFTSETRFLFQYRADTNATVSFFGDDDAWVFVNGHLAIDLGGTHSRLEESVTISAATASTYGLTPGNLYEITVFHADRHPRDSNYQLTLSGFDVERSECSPTCGDGVKTPLEECDLGIANDDAAYGGCRTDCTYGPFCGDGQVDGPELCDDGSNITVAYGADGCSPGCVDPPHCGDGLLQTPEECDDGGTVSGDGCSATCTLD